MKARILFLISMEFGKATSYVYHQIQTYEIQQEKNDFIDEILDLNVRRR